MKLCTTSETISFGRELEENSAKFYLELSERFEQAKEWARFAEENRKYVVQVQRAYQSVISDAIEGCFAFDLEAGDYVIDTNLPADRAFKDTLEQAIRIEETIIAFYNTAADQSMALMADVPRNFKMVAKKRAKRLELLKQMR